jgi:hypothetical protein
MPFGHVELNDGNKVGGVVSFTDVYTEAVMQLPLIAFGTGTALYGKVCRRRVSCRPLSLTLLGRTRRTLSSALLTTALITSTPPSVHIVRALATISPDPQSIYNNEESVGTAIKESGLGRNEFFLTTKYDGGDIAKEARASLAKLGLMYADLYLIHFPGLVTGRFEAAWAEFEQLKEDGLVRSIGVSNFSAEDLQLLAKTAFVRFHAGRQKRSLICAGTARLRPR